MGHVGLGLGGGGERGKNRQMGEKGCMILCMSGVSAWWAFNQDDHHRSLPSFSILEFLGFRVLAGSGNARVHRVEIGGWAVRANL